MTKREIIYTVFEKLKIQTDDSDITEELIASMIDTKRAMLLKQQFAKNPWHMPIEVKQEICVDLEVANSVAGVACLGKILRTVNPLPSSIKVKGKEGPLNIRRMDRSAIAINLVPIERLPYVGYNSIIGAMLYAAIDYDGRLYFTSTRKNHLFLETVKVSDIFEHPDTAYALECENDSAIIEPWDTQYPIEVGMVDPIINLIAQDLGRTIQMPEDNVNDAEDVRE